MKAVFHKMASVLMAFVVLFSTMSFTIDMHYCGDKLVETALFKKAKGCGMEIETTSNSDCNITKKSCCKDEIVIVEGQKELKFSSFEDLNFQQQLFFTAFTYSYINLFEGLPKQTIPHKDYSPPNLVADIQVLDQVFII